jgi:general secretion pathway protein L
MSSAFNNITAASTNFLSWWGGELAGFLPRALRAGAQVVSPNRIISLEDGRARLIAANGMTSNDRLSTTDVVDALASQKNNATLRVGVRVPYQACFSRRVELPSAAIRDFPRLLALDLERATPFKPRDVRTVYYLDNDQPVAGKTALRQLVLKRSSVDGVITALQDAGLNVIALDCWTPDGQAALPVNFLDTATNSTSNRTGWFWPIALTASASALAIFAGHTFLARHEAALASIKVETSKLHALNQQRRSRSEEMRVRQAEVKNFAQVLASAPSKALALEELTRLLPDSARVTDLKLDGTTVDISGVAQSAIGLMPVLERSTLFVNAEQTAPIMADQREGKDRFSIRVRIRSSLANSVKSSESVKAEGGVQ